MSDDHDVTGSGVELAWSRHRHRVLDVAYRMLGSRVEADDVVAEAYTRLVERGVDGLDEPRGWLVTVTSRLCLDRLRSAEVRRRAYVGPWLPEPILSQRATGLDPADRVTLDDSVRMALLVVLEQLSPAERTVYVLTDVFSVPFGEVATIVGRSPAACRQLAARARARIAADASARFKPDPDHHRDMVERFARACASGDLDALVAVLHADASGKFDSAGLIAHAPLRTVTGNRAVANVLLTAFARTNARFEVDTVNGEPGVIITIGDHIVAVIALGVHGGRIITVQGIGNPAKLRH